jgi:hypothetical protein
MALSTTWVFIIIYFCFFQVNDENVTSMKTPEVIDLLRLLRGSICITVLRPPSAQ